MQSEPLLALLKVMYPDGTEQLHEVRVTPYNIGRLAPAELVLPLPNISRQHARLLVEDGQIILMDLNSSNGTILNGTRLEPNQPYPLQPGDCFEIAVFKLCVEPLPVIATEKPAEEPETSAPVEHISYVQPVTVRKPEEAAPGLAAPEPAEPVPVDQEVPPQQVDMDIAVNPVKTPPPPPPRSGNGKDGHLPYDELFGLPRDHSRYLQYLPPIYQENAFLGRFLLAFEGVLTPVEQMVDHFDLYLDPRTAPPFFLEALAAWLGMPLDENWPVEMKRLMVAEASELFRRRGTRWALRRHLEIISGVQPEIIEPQKDSDPAHHFRVILRLPKGQKLDRSMVERIIQLNKPAHTTYTLELMEEG